MSNDRYIDTLKHQKHFKRILFLDDYYFYLHPEHDSDKHDTIIHPETLISRWAITPQEIDLFRN